MGTVEKLKTSKLEYPRSFARTVFWKWIPMFVMTLAVWYLYVELSTPNRNTDSVEATLSKLHANMVFNLFANSAEECIRILKKYPEPYLNHSTKKTIDLDGPVYATYNWTRPITQDQINEQRNLSKSRGNTRVIFKVKDSVLYVDTTGVIYNKLYRDGAKSTAYTVGDLKFRLSVLIELLLLTVHLYNIPDLDFVVELSDVVHPTNPPHPVFSYSISGRRVDAGFTIPSYGAFERSLGQNQLLLLEECLKVQHPRDIRINKAVWRGTTTGFQMFGANDALKNHRVNLSYNCAKRPDLFDVGIVEYLQIDENDTKLIERLMELVPKKKRIPMSRFNDYAVVLDVDGNGWSDRLPILLRGDAVVLKQEYNRHLDYLTEIAKQSDAITFFKWDQSDLETQASMLLREYNEEKEIWEARIEKMTDFAKEYVSQEGVIRATAYALTNYAKFQNWEVEEQEGYVVIPRALCCKTNSALPKELIKEVQSS
eukprot:g4154.t1